MVLPIVVTYRLMKLIICPKVMIFSSTEMTFIHHTLALGISVKSGNSCCVSSSTRKSSASSTLRLCPCIFASFLEKRSGRIRALPEFGGAGSSFCLSLSNFRRVLIFNRLQLLVSLDPCFGPLRYRLVVDLLPELHVLYELGTCHLDGRLAHRLAGEPEEHANREEKNLPPLLPPRPDLQDYQRHVASEMFP